jgi:peptidoglycan hydrolase-like amidase
MPYLGTTGGAAALQAQAVAARSYAYAVVHRASRRIAPGAGAGLRLTACVDRQPRVDRCRHLTAGQVMTHPSRVIAGSWCPSRRSTRRAPSAPPRTPRRVLPGVPYLRSVDDHWACSRGGQLECLLTGRSPDRRCTALPGLTSVTDLAITKCSTTGAALEITFSGAGGPRTFKTRDLRGFSPPLHAGRRSPRRPA